MNQLLLVGCIVTLFLVILDILLIPFANMIAKEIEERRGKKDFKPLKVEHGLFIMVILFMWSIFGITYFTEAVAKDSVMAVISEQEQSTCTCGCDACKAGNCDECAMADENGYCMCCDGDSECAGDCDGSCDSSCTCGCQDVKECSPTDAEHYENTAVNYNEIIDKTTGLTMYELAELNEIPEGNVWVIEETDAVLTCNEEIDAKPSYYITKSTVKAEENEHGKHDLIEEEKFIYNGSREDFIKSFLGKDVNWLEDLSESDMVNVYQQDNCTFYLYDDVDDEYGKYIDFFYVENNDGTVTTYGFH